MKATLLLLRCGILLASCAAHAASTIDSTNKYAWGGNIGWVNFRDANGGAAGAVVGEYICSGYVWSGNVGWINLGDGAPTNGIQYSNGTATDYGINVQDQFVSGGVPRAKLRGYAYGANIGWINFEPQGNLELSLSTGRLSGYAWSANCGWINLGDANFAVQTTSIRPGADIDSDGIADAFEYTYTSPDSLALFTATSDRDGDGESDRDEYFANTNPLDLHSNLQIITSAASSTAFSLTWTSSPTRRYRIESTTDPTAPNWTLTLDNILPDGATTSRAGTTSPSQRRFFRIRALPALAP